MSIPASRVNQLNRVIGGTADAIQRKYRNLLRQKRLRPELASFSPAVLVQAGGNLQEWLEGARQAGRTLALDDVPVEQLFKALHLFGEVVDPEVAQAAAPLQPAAQAAATEGYLEVHASETRTLAHVLEVETAVASSEALLEGVLEALRLHLNAAESRLHHVSNPALRKRLGEFRVFAPARASGMTGDSWPGSVRSVWSLPVAVCEDSLVAAQFGFDRARAVPDRTRRFLGVIRDRCLLAVERIARERSLRERSLKLISVEEMERSRLSRELHDEPAQSLAVVRLHIEIIEGSLPEQARAQLAEVRSVLEKTILDVRRLISELSPPVLEQLGVAAAIRQLVVRFRRSYKARVSLHVGKLPDIDQQYGLVLYRSLQECFSNIFKHSGAKNINVSLMATDRVLRLHVEDDGVGFHVRETMSHARSFGLIGIRERVSLLGGRVSVLSTPVGGDKKDRGRGTGTRIEIELPFPEKNPS